MSRNFAGRCYRCGGFGHRAAECPNNWADDAGSVDESVYRQPPGFGGQERAALYNEQFGQQAGGFGGNMNAPPPLFNQQQQQQQQQQWQGQMMPQNFGGIPLAPVGERHFGIAENVNEGNVQEHLASFMRETGDQGGSCGTLFMSDQSMQEMRRYFSSQSTQGIRARLNRNRAPETEVFTIPVMGRSDRPRPGQPQPQQAGRGALRGARNAQPNRPGAGMLGNYRVERPGAARGRGQQGRGRGGRPAAREEDEPQDDAGSVASQGSRRGGRSAHTDHPAGFACRICGGADHTEADCAKPSNRGGDSSYCPYHRTVSGSEEHADSKCNKRVDRCWENAVDKDGMDLPRAEIDRLVTEFVRAHRGGRPEPRCASIHSHWAMCVSRHIRENGLDGIDASLLPVRRSETLRREARRELSWRQFNHDDVAASRTEYRDTHWVCDSADQLIQKLEAYAADGTYQSRSQRRQGRNAEDEEPAEQQDEDMDGEEEEGSAGADAGNASAEEEIAPADASMNDAPALDQDQDFDLDLGLAPVQDYAAEDDGRFSDDEEKLPDAQPTTKVDWKKPKAVSYAEGGDDQVDFGDED